MIIKVEISEETWARMLTGKRVEGSIGLDLWSKKKDFLAHRRKPRNRQKDKLVKKLPWGWVKESQQNLKVFSSVPKEMGIEKVMEAFEDDRLAAMEAMVDDYLIRTV